MQSTLESGVCWEHGWLGIVEVYGECADEGGEIGAGCEEMDKGEVAGVGGEGKMTIEESGGPRVEGRTCARRGSEGSRGGVERREDSIEQLDGEGGKGHGGCERKGGERRRKGRGYIAASCSRCGWRQRGRGPGGEREAII